MMKADVWADPLLDSAMVSESSSEDVISAVGLWNEGQSKITDFAIVAASVVGKRDGGTVRLARNIRRSVDTVETYAKGGELLLAMYEIYPNNPDVKLLKESLDISFFNVEGRVFVKRCNELKEQFQINEISGQEATRQMREALLMSMERLKEAYDSGMTVEQFRNVAPKGIDHSTWKAKAKTAADKVEDLVKSESLGADPALWKIVYKLGNSFVKWARKAAD